MARSELMPPFRLGMALAPVEADLTLGVVGILIGGRKDYVFDTGGSDFS